MTRTFTEHLKKPFYAIVNNLKYGIAEAESAKLSEALTDIAKRSAHESKLGLFVITRVSNDGLHGFRVTADGAASAELVAAVAKTNAELAGYDHVDPQAVWAEKPFWAN